MDQFRPATPSPSSNPSPSPDQDPSPAPSSATISAISQPAEPAAHVLAARFNDPWREEVETIDPGTGATVPAVAQLSKDQFYGAFKGMFQAPNVLIRPPLKALVIAPEEEEAAQAASDAIYETCAAVSWLNFLIQPQNEWAQRAFVIGVFFYGKGSLIAAELKDRRQNSPGEQEAAGKPSGGGGSAPPPPAGPRAVHQDMAVANPRKAA